MVAARHMHERVLRVVVHTVQLQLYIFAEYVKVLHCSDSDDF